MDQINPTRYSQSGKEKNENHHQILYIGISLGYKFHFEQTILSFWNKFAKKRYLQESRKNEHHCRILDIRIILGTKLQLKQTILIFWTKFAQKRYFRSLAGKKLNIIVKFGILELV